jgi:hypothetical protein
MAAVGSQESGLEVGLGPMGSEADLALVSHPRSDFSRNWFLTPYTFPMGSEADLAPISLPRSDF